MIKLFTPIIYLSYIFPSEMDLGAWMMIIVTNIMLTICEYAKTTRLSDLPRIIS